MHQRRHSAPRETTRPNAKQGGQKGNQQHKNKNKKGQGQHTREPGSLQPAAGAHTAGTSARDQPPRSPTPPPGPESLTVRGGTLRERTPRRCRRRSPSRPGCPRLVRRAHALLPAPSALYRAAPREEEIDLSLPELFATRPFNRPRPGRPRPPPPRGSPTAAACRWVRRSAGGVAGPGAQRGGGGGVQEPGSVRRRASVQCAQPPVGGEWGGRGAPPAGLKGVLRAEPRAARRARARKAPERGKWPRSPAAPPPPPRLPGPRARDPGAVSPRPPHEPG